MISVVMATFNSEKYIKKQLDSIRKQSVKVDEVIFVDDYSTDNTVAFLFSYVKKYSLESWKIYVHKENQGFVKTFTDALAKTTGEIIILCDHDDVWKKDKVKIIQDVFNNNTDVLAVATSFEKIDEDGNIISTRKKVNRSNNNIIRRKLKKGKLNKLNFYDVATYNVAPGCTCAISGKLKNVYMEYSANSILPHDWKLMFIAACLNGLFYLDKITTFYRIYSGNTIGLGHLVEYEKRKDVVSKNLKEKEEMLNLTQFYANKDDSKIKHMKALYDLFNKRKQAFEEERFVLSLKLIPDSIKFAGLYESIFLDAYSILKYKLEKK
jgi:Glycosyltransferases involved in cell wall biogenesis